VCFEGVGQLGVFGWDWATFEACMLSFWACFALGVIMAEVLGRTCRKLASLLPSQAWSIWKAWQSCCMYIIPDAILIWAVTQKLEVLRDAPSNISTLKILCCRNRSQMTWKCGKNKKLAHEEIDLATFWRCKGSFKTLRVPAVLSQKTRAQKLKHLFTLFQFTFGKVNSSCPPIAM